MDTFKINIGGMTEAEVQRSVESAFSPFFVFRAPRKKDRDEVTDVLVPWDDVGLVIQVKSQAVDLRRGGTRHPLNWAKKHLWKAARQVKGAVRAIRDGRMPYLENPLRGRIPFPKADIRWLYGVIILHHTSPPFDPFQLVPQLNRANVPLHVLSFRDFKNLTHFLDTPADLVNYLEHRSSVLVPTLTPKVHQEEEVFVYYVSNLERLMAFRARELGESFTEANARSYGEHLRRLLRGELPERRAGRVIDHMIGRAHERHPSLEPIRLGEVVVKAIPRVRRIALGRRYLRTIQLAAERRNDAWKSTHSQRRSDCMLFLASPLPNSERRERQKRLLAMTEMLKHYHQVKKAVGIATEAGGDAGRSYDYVYLEGEPVANEEASRAARKLFGDEIGLLTDEPE